MGKRIASWARGLSAAGVLLRAGSIPDGRVLKRSGRKIIGITSAGLTGTVTFYAASTSGGTPNVLNTVSIVDGLVIAWSQATAGAGTPGEWQFNDPVNSGQLVPLGIL